MAEASADLRTRLAQAFSKCATANGRRLGALRFDLADAALDVLDDDARQKVTDELMAQTKLRSMQIREGAFDMDIDSAREITATWVAAARAMLGGAENYSETPVSFEVKVAESPEMYVLTVQRAGKLTPHQARKRAERERDEWKRAAKEEAEGGKARAEMLARVEGVLDRLWEKGRSDGSGVREGAFDEAALMLHKALRGAPDV